MMARTPAENVAPYAAMTMFAEPEEVANAILFLARGPFLPAGNSKARPGIVIPPMRRHFGQRRQVDVVIWDGQTVLNVRCRCHSQQSKF